MDGGLADDRPATGGPPLASAYPLVVAAFCAALLISNIAAVKLLAIGPLTLDGGAICFPLAYILGDVLAEVWGFAAARRAIVLGLSIGIVSAMTLWAVQLAPPARNWHHQEAFEAVLGFVPRIVGASLAGYVVGQLLNAWVLVRIKEATRGRALWVRLLTSTVVGEAADTAVFCFIAYFGVITGWQWLGYALVGYAYKCVVEVLLLPVTYRVVRKARGSSPTQAGAASRRP